MKTETETRRTSRREIPLGFAAPDHTVPYGTVLSRDALPGTSCQATIVLSLRDTALSAEMSKLQGKAGRLTLEFGHFK
jgi:hypothetical protein